MSDVDTETLAEQVIEELDPGQVIDNKVILSRRQLVAIAGSGLSAGALAALGLEEASAQTGPVGQVGTSSEPVDSYIWDLDVQNGADFNGNPLNNVGAGDIEQANIGAGLSPSATASVAQIVSAGELFGSETVSIADDENIVICSASESRPILALAANRTDNAGVVVTNAGGGTELHSPNPSGEWSPSDTDGDNCVFASGGDLVLKNRTGTTKDYEVIALRAGII